MRGPSQHSVPVPMHTAGFKARLSLEPPLQFLYSLYYLPSAGSSLARQYAGKAHRKAQKGQNREFFRKMIHKVTTRQKAGFRGSQRLCSFLARYLRRSSILCLSLCHCGLCLCFCPSRRQASEQYTQCPGGRFPPHIRHFLSPKWRRSVSTCPGSNTGLPPGVLRGSTPSLPHAFRSVPSPTERSLAAPSKLQ